MYPLLLCFRYSHNIFFSCLFINFKGEWTFNYFDTSNPTAFNNDWLLLSSALSALSVLSGTVKGFRSINSIRKKLNKKKNNDNNDIPLEEVPLAIEDTIQNQSPISDRRTDSSEMAPENLDQTRQQSVAVTDLSELGDVEKIMCILPNGNNVEITPDQILEYVCP